MHAFVNIGLRAARLASEQILEAWQRPDRIRVSEKSRNDYVTDVDTRVEELLVEHIQKSYPEHSFYCEESGEIVGEDSETVWVIDPIDGTRNFIMGLPHFCISLGCVKNGQLEHAIIVDPVKDEEFTATRGSGAQLNGHRLRVGKRTDIEGGTVSLSCAGLKNYEQLMAIQASMKGTIGAIRMSGSAALDLAYHAAGRTDAGWMSGMNRSSTSRFNRHFFALTSRDCSKNARTPASATCPASCRSASPRVSTAERSIARIASIRCCCVWP